MCDLCLPRVSRRELFGRLAVGTTAVAAATLLGPATSHAAVPTAPGLEIQPRSNWAGETRPATGPIGPEIPLFLLVHHTATPNGGDPVETMRSIYSFHTGPEKGWPDVAYNFFIDDGGTVWEARSGSLDGPVEASATGGNQGFAQLVCLLGDFTAELPTPAALNSLSLTLAWLADRDGIDTAPGATVEFVSRGSNLWPAGDMVTAATISGHRDMSRTACPGDTLYPYLVSQVPAEVDTLRSAAPPTSAAPETAEDTTTTTPPPETTNEAASTTTEAMSTTTTPSSTDSTATAAPSATDGGDELAAPVPTPSGETVPDTAPDRDGSGEGAALPVIGLGATAALAAGALYLARRRANESTAGDRVEPDAETA